MPRYTKVMDEVLLRQLVRQIRVLNFWITTFGVLILISLAVMGIILFKAITFLHTTTSKLTSAQQSITQSLNVKQQVCSNSSLSSLLKENNSSVCK
jgi:hypothetical protein